MCAATVIQDQVPIGRHPHVKSEWLHPATLDLNWLKKEMKKQHFNFYVS